MLTEGKARIHAHICGDGCVYTAKEKRSPSDLKNHKRINLTRNNHTIEYWNTCPELLNEMRTDFINEFNRKATIKKKGYLRIKSAKHIIETLELERKNSYNWWIPRNVSLAADNVISNWLRAFFDDEATVEIPKRRIRVKSMNEKGLRQASILLKKLRIYENHITGPNCDNSWYLNINREGVTQYLHRVGFLHPNKKAKLSCLIEKNGPRGI